MKVNELIDSNINIKDFYQRHNEQINEVYNKIIDLSKKGIFDGNTLELELKKIVPINNEFNKMNFCQSKIVLEKAFDDEVYIEFIYRLMILFLLFFVSFLQLVFCL